MSKIVLVQAEELKEVVNEAVKPLFDNVKTRLKPKEPIEYLTRREVANLLKINLTTLWHWTNKGILVAYSISSRVYYKRHEVENAIVKLKK